MPVTDQQAVADREQANLDGEPNNLTFWQDFGLSIHLLIVIIALGAIIGHYITDAMLDHLKIVSN